GDFFGLRSRRRSTGRSSLRMPEECWTDSSGSGIRNHVTGVPENGQEKSQKIDQSQEGCQETREEKIIAAFRSHRAAAAPADACHNSEQAEPIARPACILVGLERASRRVHARGKPRG